MFRFTLAISPTDPISETEPDAEGVSHVSFMVIERQVFLPGETLEAAQAELTGDPSPFFLDRVPAGTPWKLISAREVFPPNYE
jgi:hypothetical protein